MKYLAFIACLIIGIGVYALLPGTNVRRAPEVAPRKVLVITQVDKPQVTMPTQYVVVTPYVTETDLKRVPQVSGRERRAELESKTIQR